ncbi:Oidioi.mRNA.OKI2018_I69.XSR.g15912.t1.cds [Oikopleura dioica]|uniref:Oidioi.mRNA.OKI2018_I69.XSR.g15912.t1.cds n=1 Tax=Oikopleura dioica TaxID=34765 RepID=A0ABN7SJD3_OIKDI|nr:Oidioi.mRNA.OKI2018_I69.XSR.g15912.t1.cds [Oikopleura dioica]
MRRDKRENKAQSKGTRPAFIVAERSAPKGLEGIKKEKSSIITAINATNNRAARKGKLPAANQIFETGKEKRRFRKSATNAPLLRTKRISLAHEIMVNKWLMEEHEVKELSDAFRDDTLKRENLLKKYAENLECCRKEKEQQESRQIGSFFEDEASSGELDTDELASDDLKEEKQVRKIVESFTKTNSKVGMNWLKAYYRNVVEKNEKKETGLIFKINELQEAVIRYDLS